MYAAGHEKDARRKALKAKLGLPEEFYEKLGEDIRDGLRAVEDSKKRYIKHRSEARVQNSGLAVRDSAFTGTLPVFTGRQARDQKKRVCAHDLTK